MESGQGTRPESYTHTHTSSLEPVVEPYWVAVGAMEESDCLCVEVLVAVSKVPRVLENQHGWFAPED